MDGSDYGGKRSTVFTKVLFLLAAPSTLQAPRAGSALRPRSLHHVSIAVRDLRQSREFYEKLFGAIVPTGPDGTKMQLPFLTNPQHLNLNAVGGGKVGLDHFAVAVDEPTIDRVIAAVKRALRA